MAWAETPGQDAWTHPDRQFLLDEKASPGMKGSRSTGQLPSLFEGAGDALPQEEIARLFVMDKLTGLGAKCNSSGNLLGDRLGMGSKPKGKFDAQSGKWYRSATIAQQVVSNVGIDQLMEAFNEPAIKFSSESQTGVVFNILPSDAGMQLSLMCIGDTHVDVDNQLKTALGRVGQLFSAVRSDVVFESVSGFSLFSGDEPATKLDDLSAFDSCAGMTMFAGRAGQKQTKDVEFDSSCGMSLVSPAPAAKEPRKGKCNMLSDPACEFAVTDSCAGMTVFERPPGWTPPLDVHCEHSQAGMTLFASAEDRMHAEDVTYDGACGMGMFSWKYEGMNEVEISKALSEASTSAGSVGSMTRIDSLPRLTPVGSMSSVVSALNDDDVLELMEGFAGFTFFNRKVKVPEPEDELVAVHSSVGMTMFSRNSSTGNPRKDVSAESCNGMSMFSFENESRCNSSEKLRKNVSVSPSPSRSPSSSSAGSCNSKNKFLFAADQKRKKVNLAMFGLGDESR